MESRKLVPHILLLLHLQVHLAGFYSVVVSSNIISCHESEKDVLLNFKQGFTNPSDLLSSWTFEQDCCEWKGVECDNRTGHVTTLDLHSTRQADSLRGELGISLLGLPYLRHLDLSNNDFLYIQIPEFIGSFKNLEYLNLSSANFRGIVPDHLGNLSHLQYLDLSGSGYSLRVNSLDWLSRLSSLEVVDLSWVELGSLNGWLDAINMLPSLVQLNLSACHLYSLPHTLPFLNFTSLQILDISLNHFGSSIPSWLFNLSRLSTLNLKNSEICGSIPEKFQEMTSLTVLDLSENNLRGELPSSLPSLLKEVRFSRNRLSGSLDKKIMHLKQLVVLDVAWNSLEDTITQESLNFSDLRVLDLSCNSIVLKMSKRWIPSFQLDIIALRSCLLGKGFPSWLRTQKTLSSIDISNAGISDKVPDWFWDLSPAMEHMNLSWNQLSGHVPDLSRFISLSVLDLSWNNFRGPLPHFSSRMKFYILTGNVFSDTIYPICESLVENNSLSFLDLSRNNLSGPLPDCWVNGTKLIVLKLGSNLLFGKIPQSLGSLDNLKMLRLEDNNFLGELPSSLQNLRKLTIFYVASNDLTGNIPIWIGESYKDLMVLSLRGNQFSGIIPVQLCGLEHLIILDLGNNALTGTIPRCVNNFLIMSGAEDVPSFIYDPETEYDKYVLETVITINSLENMLTGITAIDLSGNLLSGEIPGELTSLVRLSALDLSANNLTGPIPPSIINMVTLVGLDLSRNNLSCSIPPNMSDLRSLVDLNLSYNHLTGEIPKGGQFVLFDRSSYRGNRYLCGPPLTTECSTPLPHDPYCINNNDPKFQDIQHPGSDDWLDGTASFFISMGAGFIPGFWAFWGSLLLSKSWRYAYFRFLNNTADKIYVFIAIKLRNWKERKQINAE